eukprot:g32884.t1
MIQLSYEQVFQIRTLAIQSAKARTLGTLTWEADLWASHHDWKSLLELPAHLPNTQPSSLPPSPLQLAAKCVWLALTTPSIATGTQKMAPAPLPPHSHLSTTSATTPRPPSGIPNPPHRSGRSKSSVSPYQLVPKGVSSKLFTQWKGPYQIMEQTGPLNYKIRGINNCDIVLRLAEAGVGELKMFKWRMAQFEITRDFTRLLFNILKLILRDEPEYGDDPVTQIASSAWIIDYCAKKRRSAVFKLFQYESVKFNLWHYRVLPDVHFSV